jgi:hypothetical protein
MSIRDFHSKFVSASPENALFRALRKLSQLDDLKSMVAKDDEPVLGWGEWSAN